MELMKKRQLIIKSRDSETRRIILKSLVDSDGVYQVEDSDGDKFVKLKYDLNKISLQVIESLVRNLHGDLDNGFLAKLKRGFVHYFEKNEIDNIRAPSLPCCSDPEKIIQKAR